MCLDPIDLSLLIECMVGFRSAFLHMNATVNQTVRPRGADMLLSEIRSKIKPTSVSVEQLKAFL